MNMDTGNFGHPILQHFLNPKFQGFCGKTNIEINRKVGIKIKNPLGGICRLSVPSKYLFLCARRKFRFNKKICRKLLTFLHVLRTKFLHYTHVAWAGGSFLRQWKKSSSSPRAVSVFLAQMNVPRKAFICATNKLSWMLE